MKSFVIWLSALALTVAPRLSAADSNSSPVIVIEPFEPPLQECYDAQDKFRTPELIVTPKIDYPFIRSSGTVPTATILVQLDENGAPKKLSVLNSTSAVHSRAAIDGLKVARWKVDSKRTTKNVWFYFQVVFDLR